MGIKISVITINLNNLEGLKRTVKSVLDQNHPDIEYLLIDGGSTDGAKEFIQDNQDSFAFYLSEKDTGVYDAMNKGIRKSTGDFLIFLNSGDVFSDSDSLSKLIENSNGEELVYGNILVVESDKSYLKTYPEILTFKYFYYDSIPHPACLISKELFERYGLYDTTLKIVSDWKFFLLSVVKYRCSYRYVDEMISTFGVDGLSSLSTNRKLQENERVRTLKKYFYGRFWLYTTYLKFLNKSFYNKS